MKTNKIYFSTDRIAKIALMSALSFVLMFIKLPFPVFSWLSIDLADLPVVITSFAYGPIAGVIVAFVKNALHLAYTETALIGELANFIIAASFALSAGVVYKINKTRKGAFFACAIGVVTITITGLFINYFIMAELYGLAKILPKLVLFGKTPTMWDYLIFGVLPFNVLKATLTSMVTIVVYKPLSRVFFKSTKRTLLLVPPQSTADDEENNTLLQQNVSQTAQKNDIIK